MARYVVPASVLQNLIELALHSRVNLEELFSEAGVDPDLVGRSDALVPAEQLDRLLSRAVEKSADPWFGLHAGSANQPHTLDVLGRLMATSSTLRDAIHELLRFKDLVAPFLHFALDVDGDSAVLACWPADDSMAFTRLRAHNELVTATMVSIGRALAGGDIGVRGAAFRHAHPGELGEYHRVFGEVPLQFGAPRNEVRFDAGVLDRRLSSAYPRYRERVEQLAEQQLSRLSRGHTVAAQVSALLAERLGEASIAIDEVARQFNMTARTLQRRLRDEDMTFAALRDRVRHEAACRLLADAALDMDTVAQRLGFSDTANFYHAFRRWEGRTPGDYRRACAAGATAGGSPA